MLSLNLVSIGSGNGLMSIQHQANTCTDADLSSIRTPWKDFNELSFEIQTFSLIKLHLELISATHRPFCLSLNSWKCIDPIKQVMTLYVIQLELNKSSHKKININGIKTVFAQKLDLYK